MALHSWGMNKPENGILSGKGHPHCQTQSFVRADTSSLPLYLEHLLEQALRARRAGCPGTVRSEHHGVHFSQTEPKAGSEPLRTLFGENNIGHKNQFIPL